MGSAASIPWSRASRRVAEVRPFVCRLCALLPISVTSSWSERSVYHGARVPRTGPADAHDGPAEVPAVDSAGSCLCGTSAACWCASPALSSAQSSGQPPDSGAPAFSESVVPPGSAGLPNSPTRTVCEEDIRGLMGETGRLHLVTQGGQCGGLPGIFRERGSQPTGSNGGLSLAGAAAGGPSMVRQDEPLRRCAGHAVSHGLPQATTGSLAGERRHAWGRTAGGGTCAIIVAPCDALRRLEWSREGGMVDERHPGGI